jgi:hypothetical protein
MRFVIDKIMFGLIPLQLHLFFMTIIINNAADHSVNSLCTMCATGQISQLITTILVLNLDSVSGPTVIWHAICHLRGYFWKAQEC